MKLGLYSGGTFSFTDCLSHSAVFSLFRTSLFFPTLYFHCLLSSLSRSRIRLKHSHISLPISADRHRVAFQIVKNERERKKNFTTFFFFPQKNPFSFFLSFQPVIARGARFRAQLWRCAPCVELPSAIRHGARHGAHGRWRYSFWFFFFCVSVSFCASDSRPLLLGHAGEWLAIWWIICNDDLPTSLRRCQFGIRGIVRDTVTKSPRLMGCTHCQLGESA